MINSHAQRRDADHHRVKRRKVLRHRAHGRPQGFPGGRSVGYLVVRLPGEADARVARIWRPGHLAPLLPSILIRLIIFLTIFESVR